MDSASERKPGPASDMSRLRRENFALAGNAVPPRNNTERQLLEIWERVLDIGGLGVEDDFFELGGESLAAVTLFTEMERVLGPMPPLSTLLECTTVRRLAHHLDLLPPTEKNAPIPVSPRRRSRVAGRLLALFAWAVKGGAT